VAAEFASTARYAVDEPNGYGWSATIGDDAIAWHMGLDEWGWNARGCSSHYLAAEFAQGTVADAITDGQVRAFALFVRLAAVRWPKMPLYWPTHAELDGTALYGQFDGKSDVFPRSDARANELRARIMARLATA